MGFDSFYIHAADGTVLHFKVANIDSGLPACLLVHGYGDGSHVWQDTIEALCPFCSVVVVDLRGHGESGISLSRDYSLEAYVADTERVVRTLALKRLYIIGHSLGGQIAIRLIASLRQSVMGAILADTCARPNEIAFAHVKESLKKSIRVYASPDEYSRFLITTRPLLSASVAAQLASGALRLIDGGYELKVDPLLAADNFEASNSTINPEVDLLELLPHITCPTLVMRGEASALVSLRAASEMIGLLRNGRLSTIGQAGHALMSDNPERFVREVCAFMEKTIADLTDSRK
jgi:pimeloyl-ACP methyl ester carboxylesterase